MAFGNTILLEVNPGGSDTNGGGFDPGSANFATDLAATGGTSTAPVVTSASYSFGSIDDGAMLFIPSGTGWIPGWYPIVSVSGGAATLNAAIGAVTLYNGATVHNTTAGCATVASPTAGKWGVDYSLQTAAAIPYGDLVIDGTTNTKFTSSAFPVAPNLVGNLLNITGGSGFTLQRVQVLSTSGTTATVDKSLGTLGSVAGSGKLGGALASPGQLAQVLNAGPATSVSFVNFGNYSLTNTANVSGGRLGNYNGGYLIGYSTNRSLLNTDPKPTFRAAAGNNSFTLVTLGQNSGVIANINFDNPNNCTSMTAIGSGGSSPIALNCTIANYATGIAFSNNTPTILNCGVANSTSVAGAIQVGSQGYIEACSIVNSNAGFAYSGLAENGPTAVRCSVNGNNGNGNGFNLFRVVSRCDVYNITGANRGFLNCGFHINCYADSCTTGYGNTTTNVEQSLINCAGFNNTTQYETSFHGNRVQNFKTLTASALTNPGAGNFGPNATAGGGAVLRGAAWPGVIAGLASTTDYADIGAVQHADPTGGGGGVSIGSGGG